MSDFSKSLRGESLLPGSFFLSPDQKHSVSLAVEQSLALGGAHKGSWKELVQYNPVASHHSCFIPLRHSSLALKAQVHYRPFTFPLFFNETSRNTPSPCHWCWPEFVSLSPSCTGSTSGFPVHCPGKRSSKITLLLDHSVLSPEFHVTSHGRGVGAQGRTLHGSCLTSQA